MIESDGSAAAPKGARQNTSQAATNAGTELRMAVRMGLIGLFGPFLRRLPQVFPEQAQGVNDGARLWMETFIRQVEAHLLGGAAYRAGAAADEAVGGAEVRAESQHAVAVQALYRRLEALNQRLGLPLSGGALAPAGLYRALQETAEALGWPARHRAALFEQFDQFTQTELERFYSGLATALGQIRPGATAGTAAATAAPKRQLDAQTHSMLRQRASAADGASGDDYNDSALAAELLALADQPVPEGSSREQMQAPLQRMALAGQFLNQTVSDPLVPKELRPSHEPMRFPLVKSALADATLFTSALHPLAGLVNEMALKAATSRVTGDVEMRMNAERLEQLLVQFDLSPEFVRTAMANAQPLAQTQIEWFFELQQKQAELRRQTVIDEAKRRVVREIERSTFGRDIPATALGFLRSAWGPLLAARLVEHGADHFAWNAGLALMDQLLDLLESRKPGQAAPEMWGRTIGTLLAELARAGVGNAVLADAVSDLEKAWRAPRAPTGF